MQHDIGVLMEEQKENQMKMEAMKEEIKNLNLQNLDPARYLEWEHQQILEWILSLENGRYTKYEHALRESLADEEIQGAHLFKSGCWGYQEMKSPYNNLFSKLIISRTS